MHRWIITIICLMGYTYAFSQKTTVKTSILTENEIATIFTDSVKKKFNLSFPIFRVYSYADASGQFYSLLMESRDSIYIHHVNKNLKDTFSYKIRSVTFKHEGGRLSHLWDFSDAADRTKPGELAIWFWSKYSEFNDQNGDNIIDPVIIYGTAGKNNGFENGRLNFVLYQHGHAIYIRHQQGSDSTKRILLIDKEFYTTPVELQQLIKTKMELMVKNLDAIFPMGWQKAMDNKKVMIIEYPLKRKLHSTGH